ncbi:MAG: hypothetical protein LAO55_07175 [Acidobacteriia bacterium]|nr:hypothetical protein [Terriglobia bacterium]
MRPISIAAIVLCVPAFSQSGRIQNGTASFKNGLGFAYETRLEPPIPSITGEKFGGGVHVDEGIHRFLVDNSRHVYFGYDVAVDRLPEESTYRVTIRPLSIGAERLHYFSDPANWSILPLPLPGYPAPQTLHSGDVMALDLMTNAETGQKIVDYLTIQEPRRGLGTFNPDPPRQFSYVPGTPRDFTIDDASLRLSAPRLTINGKLDESSARSNGEVTGAAIWIYAANRGRFILSLVPNQALGFRKAGEVRGSLLTFTIGADSFSINCANPIVPGEAPFNLYVLQDRTWKPTYAFADVSTFTMGAADRAELLVKR